MANPGGPRGPLSTCTTRPGREEGPKQVLGVHRLTRTHPSGEEGPGCCFGKQGLDRGACLRAPDRKCQRCEAKGRPTPERLSQAELGLWLGRPPMAEEQRGLQDTDGGTEELELGPAPW